MVNPNAQFTYQATRISTATKEQLLLITYDIGIKACHTAENALLGKTNGGTPDYDLANREIIRAQEVIRELMVTLNRERGVSALGGCEHQEGTRKCPDGLRNAGRTQTDVGRGSAKTPQRVSGCSPGG